MSCKSKPVEFELKHLLSQSVCAFNLQVPLIADKLGLVDPYRLLTESGRPLSKRFHSFHLRNLHT